MNSYAHPSNIPLSLDAPEPRAGPRDVVVEVYSAGMNFFDVRPSTWRSEVLLIVLDSSCKHKENTKFFRHFHL